MHNPQLGAVDVQAHPPERHKPNRTPLIIHNTHPNIHKADGNKTSNKINEARYFVIIKSLIAVKPLLLIKRSYSFGKRLSIRLNLEIYSFFIPSRTIFRCAVPECFKVYRYVTLAVAGDAKIVRENSKALDDYPTPLQLIENDFLSLPLPVETAGHINLAASRTCGGVLYFFFRRRHFISTPVAYRTSARVENGEVDFFRWTPDSDRARTSSGNGGDGREHFSECPERLGEDLRSTMALGRLISTPIGTGRWPYASVRRSAAT
ncbi:hypothetical protein GWI33_004259 [Rhynchophorus ferrugineus]|uniref:Uncharacterized protein n=1 Tax=Rhynchophorus ferrugineus TaxID=354439 RepID=A0A834MGX4_RHYFE|nr:hypothetical protein GWI33_004259 [Rhynchophorus ferrugineus]